MRRPRFAFLVLFLHACGGVPYSVGADQPIRIREGSYHPGALPGSDAVDGGTTSGPRVTAIDTPNTVIAIGQAGKVFGGRVSSDAVTVAIAFLDLGSAHWIVDVGAPDPVYAGEYDFTATADFGRDIPPGIHVIGFVAIDASGNAGVRTTLSVCILPDVPDNANACDPTTFAPPDAVISLGFSTDVDLDLVVETPSGKIVRAKSPTTASVDGGTIPSSLLADPSTGVLTRDSNSDCRIDGVRRESLVFQGPPPSGTYRVYASLHQSCGLWGTDYRVSIFRAMPAPSGGESLVRTDLAEGTVLAVQSTGSATLGTYVTSVTFP